MPKTAQILPLNLPATLPGALLDAAAAFPDREAVVGDGRRLTFADLRDAVAAAAARLEGQGFKSGDRAAIWAPNGVAWIVACLAVQALGGAVVTLNTRLKGEEARYILDKTRARTLFTVRGFLGVDYPGLLAGLDLPHLEHVEILDADWPGRGAAPPGAVEALADHVARVRPEDPCDILFTSGTTGQPKGVVATHGQTVRAFSVWAERAGLRAGDRYLIVNPFFHTFGYKAGWLACLLKGATAYPMAVFDAAEMARLARAEAITVLPGPPTIFQQLLAAPEAAGGALASVRVAVTGAASVAPALIERMRGELGIATVLTAYGLTESCGMVTMSEPGDSVEKIATTGGKPIPGIEVRCMGPDGRPVPTGEEGEVWVRGFNVTPGYFEDPEATAEAIDAEGWLHTGDVGRFDADGYLQITDRLKDMYISGGFNCYPAEIERIVMGHPAVAQVAVVGVPDTRLGEVGKAFVVPRAGAELDPAELVDWCRAHMANYKAPRCVEVVETLPTNAAGKVQKFLLTKTAPEAARA